MRWLLVLALIVTGCGGGTAVPADRAADLDGDVVRIPAGAFVMGSAAGRANEAPPHEVRLPAYTIDRYEVTVAQYVAFVAATGWRLPGNWDGPVPSLPGNLPVTHVAWPDAAAYCEWAGKRLPTEAEWERAARGDDGRRYPWGDEWDPGRAAVAVDSGPVPVGSFPEGASPYGVLDMAGNVHEWVADYYGAGYYAVSPGDDPVGPEDHGNRVLRGGSWSSPSEWATTTFRDSSHSDVGDDRFGFRCASG